MKWKIQRISTISHKQASLFICTKLTSRLCWCRSRPVGSVCCGCNGKIHTDYRNPVEKKGWHGHSEWERARGPEGPTSAWSGFYCFSGYITSRMILIYYAQVRCRWLPFTDNKGKNVANYFIEKGVTDQGEKWLNWLHSILGRFSTDFRKLKMLRKHLLSQFRVSKSHSSLGTMQAWFPMGEPVRGRGFCVPDLTPHWPFWVGAGVHSPCQAEWFRININYHVLSSGTNLLGSN